MRTLFVDMIEAGAEGGGGGKLVADAVRDGGPRDWDWNNLASSCCLIFLFSRLSRCTLFASATNSLVLSPV